jgi:hypothetical protein
MNADRGRPIMSNTRRLVWAGVACITTIASLSALAQNDKSSEDLKRPKLTLRTSSAIATSPARITLTAELVGGANDYQEYYCPTVEWNWGDGTRSESDFDCEPYQAGKSEIRRHFVVQHVFRTGDYHVTFRLRRRDKALAAITADFRIQPSPNEIGESGPGPRRPGSAPN